MKLTWLVGAFAGVMLAGSAVAQTQPQQTTGAERDTTTMRQRGTTGTTTAVPTGQTTLGTVTIPRPVMADGKPLPRGSYTLRLTAQSAQPTVPGQLPDLNRWV